MAGWRETQNSTREKNYYGDTERRGKERGGEEPRKTRNTRKKDGMPFFTFSLLLTL
jgi:hypothetical protein